MEQIQGEVRMYYTGRIDFDTEYFQAASLGDIQLQATAIAKRNRADHFNFSLATEEVEQNYRSTRVPKVKGMGGSVKDQVKAIEFAIGVQEED
jgi:hypothetical protein